MQPRHRAAAAIDRLRGDVPRVRRPPRDAARDRAGRIEMDGRAAGGVTAVGSASVYSRQQLATAFQSLGIEPADVVMVHASVSAVGPVAGGPDQVHLALKDALTPAGTLMMYAGCPQYVDEVGRGNL